MILYIENPKDSTPKDPKIYNEEMTVSSINNVGRIGQPHAKELKWTTILYNTPKIIQNGLKTLM